MKTAQEIKLDSAKSALAAMSNDPSVNDMYNFRRYLEQGFYEISDLDDLSDLLAEIAVAKSDNYRFYLYLRYGKKGAFSLKSEYA